ncbi:MAG: ribonuclease III [Cyanobacteria bacterium]|nr:ribonuclease III [Cyanobacteriota bacterium]MDW8201198.1 ribonuclease III [Cyanobacteriota bacterium SKYGB_h_bin112]
MTHELLIFKNQQLLQQALTHRSYVKEHPGTIGDNERLEFLGDAILTFLCAEYLYHRYPGVQEDVMTRRRAALVDEQQLAQFALDIGLGPLMRLGRGVIRDGGLQNFNLLSSTFEAVVGAYYLDKDSDIGAVRVVIERLFDSVPDEVMVSRSAIDVKNQLQEWAQANLAGTLPHYVTEKSGGLEHAPLFMATVFLNNQSYGQGEGRTKKEAEKRAAEAAIAYLKRQGLL